MLAVQQEGANSCVILAAFLTSSIKQIALRDYHDYGCLVVGIIPQHLIHYAHAG